MFQLNPTHDGLTKFQHSPTPFVAPAHHSKSFLNPNAHRNFSKASRASGLVKMSAICSAVGTYSRVIFFASRTSRIQCCWMSIGMLGFIVELGVFDQIQRTLVIRPNEYAVWFRAIVSRDS
jgi:hypothetical protein